MRIVIFTSNAIRHRYVANVLTNSADDVMVVCECRPSDNAGAKLSAGVTLLERSFHERYLAERRLFADHDVFFADSLPILRGEVNNEAVVDVVKKFKPDAMFVFGASIIKEPLISLLPPGHFINMHLGLSPYYRGAATNFWPFINDELEYIGATILHLDPGIDTGDIIAHVRPKIERGDNAATVGCKTIQSGAEIIARCLGALRNGEDLPRVKQWPVSNARMYKIADVTDEVMLKYYDNMARGMVEKYINNPPPSPRLIEWR